MILSKPLIFFFSTFVISCSAHRAESSQYAEIDSNLSVDETIPDGGVQDDQNKALLKIDSLKVHAIDVAVAGKSWPRHKVRIEKSELMKLDEKGPHQLIVILQGAPFVGKEFATLQFSIVIPSDYGGSPITYDLSQGESGVPVISFSEDNEVFTSWSAPWIITWDEVNNRRINEPKTSGSVTLESFDQRAKRIRISFDTNLFGASSDTTTSTIEVSGAVELDFSVYDLLAEAEKMKKQYGIK